ncbi:MAG: PrsW family intramembrane metalloprotease [Vicinamibacteria bacterium]|nr:PrsW family intramembrane metalloprotease [Vicinamibacteria bacterium]
MRVVIALAPVLLFIGLLLLLDSFKLVRLRAVLQAIAAGAFAALLALAVNLALLDRLGLELAAFTRYGAPGIEEGLKAGWVLFLIRRQRVGFLVDAAILGFAVGAGFALVENVDYLEHVESAGLSLWFARGCGTAVLHGATTATVAVLGKNAHDRRPGFAAFLPGLLIAILIHSLFNHFVLPPLMSALVLLATLPLLLIFVFHRAEKTTREWLSGEFDGELQMLQEIRAGQVAHTRTGAYLESLKTRFEGTLVADMLCLLQIQLELKVRAKGILMAREAGIDLPVGEDVRDNLKELHYLQSQIGRTGLIAMRPILSLNSRDIWQLSMMEEAGRTGGSSSAAATSGAATSPD